MANDTGRFNNFDNLVYIETRSPQQMLAELQKIVKPAKILFSGHHPTTVGFWALIEIQGEGQEKKKRGKKTAVKKTEETKTEIMELNNG